MFFFPRVILGLVFLAVFRSFFSDTKIGDYTYIYDDLKLLRNGVRWIPIKFQGTFAGELEIEISGMEENDLEIEVQFFFFLFPRLIFF